MNTNKWDRIRDLFGQVMEAPPSERQALSGTLSEGDEEVALELRSLVAAHEADEDFLEQGPMEILADPVRVGERLGAYRIRDVLGEGGMGLVYRASRDDGAFEAMVALKVMRRSLRSPSAEWRFATERRLLARLSHPHIARLLDAGTDADGIPYFVMEYVEGMPIQEYCASKALSVPDRLRLFATVCDAVGFAHRNLIVHLDLKPGNILVTPVGEPKLLDFGIGRLLDENESSGPTPLASDEGPAGSPSPMTPEWASPEQMGGGIVTTLSDVYQLGLILNCLLTGATPGGSARASQTGSIPTIAPPGKTSSVRPRAGGGGNSVHLHGDLEAIVRKALRDNPHERYGSPDRLAEDVRRHLSGLPVRARPQTLGYRASRMMARHRAGVALAAVLMLLSLGALSTILWQWREARVQRSLAEKRLADVRRLTASTLYRVDAAIQSLSGATAPRRLMVNQAIEQLDNLTLDAESDDGLRADIGLAYLRAGDIQGRLGAPNVGDIKGALKSYSAARSIFADLTRGPSATLQQQAWRGIATLRVGETLSVLGRTAEALAQSRDSVRILEAVVAQPQGGVHRADLASAYQSLATTLAWGGDPRSALAVARQARVIFEELLAAQPRSSALRRLAAISIYKVGELRAEGNDRAGARRDYEEAVRILTETGGGLEVEDMREIGFAYIDMADNDSAQGHLTQAVSSYRKAEAYFSRFHRIDPQNADAQLWLGVIHSNLGQLLFQTGDRRAAESHLEEARSMELALRTADPDNVQMAVALANTYERSGQVARGVRGDDCGQAMEWRRQALEIWESLRSDGRLIGSYAIKPQHIQSLIDRCRPARAVERP